MQAWLQQLKLVVAEELLLSVQAACSLCPVQQWVDPSPEPCCAPQPPFQQRLTVPEAGGCSGSPGPADKEATHLFKLMICLQRRHPTNWAHQQAREARQLLTATLCLDAGQMLS